MKLTWDLNGHDEACGGLRGQNHRNWQLKMKGCDEENNEGITFASAITCVVCGLWVSTQLS